MNNLYVVPTPIGNLNDFTLRSIEILKSVEYILCEDTKVTGKIKHHFDLKAKLISLHKFNEAQRVDEVKRLLEESDVVLVSDAGTPTISDPGQLLINKIKDEVNVIPLPGATAITTALSGSGLLFDNFTFIGFFEKEQSKIISEVNKFSNSSAIVVYESPNRINKTLNILFEEFGDIEVVVARELTKIYEDIIRGKISDLKDREYRGEIVLIINGDSLPKIKNDLEENVDALLKEGMSEKSIINYLTSTKQFRKNDIYNYIKTRKNEHE